MIFFLASSSLHIPGTVEHEFSLKSFCLVGPFFSQSPFCFLTRKWANLTLDSFSDPATTGDPLSQCHVTILTIFIDADGFAVPWLESEAPFLCKFLWAQKLQNVSTKMPRHHPMHGPLNLFEHGASMVTYLGAKLPFQPCSNLVHGCGVLTYRPPTMEEPANFDNDYGNKTRKKILALTMKANYVH